MQEIYIKIYIPGKKRLGIERWGAACDAAARSARCAAVAPPARSRASAALLAFSLRYLGHNVSPSVMAAHPSDPSLPSLPGDVLERVVHHLALPCDEEGLPAPRFPQPAPRQAVTWG